jgi:phosphoglycolate phosphatase-like HAD superfamily hydrolase
VLVTDAQDVQVVVFDLDGVLVDSWTLMQQVFAAACEPEHRMVPIEQFRRLLGLPLPEIAARLGLGQAFVATYERLASERAGTIRVFPGAPAILDGLRALGYRLAVNTGKGRRRTCELLARLGLGDRFDVLVTGDDVSRGKPDPESLQAIARMTGVPERRLAFIGDMAVDVACARAAGAVPIAVLWGMGTPEELEQAGPSIRVAEMSGLLDLFQRSGRPVGAFASE